MQTRLPTEERQAEIVEAALRLASESSPALITTGDIAAAIGVTQGAVFKHFPTKDAIWLAAMRWVRETLLLQNLQAAADQSATPLDALAAMFRAHVEFVIERPGVPRVLFGELQRAGDTPTKAIARQLMVGYRARVARELHAARDAGEIADTTDVEAATVLFLAMVQGMVMQGLAIDDFSAMPILMRRLFDLFRRSLGAASCA